MIPSISPARNTSERIFSASKHTPTDDKIPNNTKMPTARTALEGKAMKTIAETYFQYPDDPDIPLVQLNALNDIKKLNDDDLINIATDEDALFSWSLDDLMAQDGWRFKAPSTLNIDDDDDQTQNLLKDDGIHDDQKGNHASRTAGGKGRFDFSGVNNLPTFDEDDYNQLPHAQNLLNDEDNEYFIVPGQFDDPPEDGDDANDDVIKLLGDKDIHN